MEIFGVVVNCNRHFITETISKLLKLYCLLHLHAEFTGNLCYSVIQIEPFKISYNSHTLSAKILFVFIFVFAHFLFIFCMRKTQHKSIKIIKIHKITYAADWTMPNRMFLCVSSKFFSSIFFSIENSKALQYLKKRNKLKVMRLWFMTMTLNKCKRFLLLWLVVDNKNELRKDKENSLL